MDSGEDHHRVVVFHAVHLTGKLTRIHVGDFLIHIEEVAIALAYCVDTKAVDSLREVEEHGKTGVVHAEALVATLLSGTRSNVARHEVTEGRIAALQVVVAILFGNVATLDFALLELLCVFEFLGNPDAAVVTERLRHKGEFRLLVAVYGDTGGVNLHVSRICEVGTLAVASYCGATVAAHSVCRKEICVAVTAGGDNHSVSGKALKLAGYEVFGDDTAGTAVDDNYVVHLIAVEALHLAELDLAVERRVSTEKELLSGLTLGIESTRYLCTTERAVGEGATIFASERHALSYALVDDVV